METWTFSWVIRNLLAELLMPPGIWVLLVVIALLFLKKRLYWQRGLIFFSVGMIWLTSTPMFGTWLTQVLNPVIHWPTPLTLTRAQKISDEPVAIVILGGGRRKGASEYPHYGYQDVSKWTMERLRYGATLAKQTAWPILVTGGAPDKTSEAEHPEAFLMASVLQKELGIAASWIEGQSHTTQENAWYSAKLLQANGIHHIYLVTHFWHMPRAAKIFEQYGLKVTPAPHGYESSDSWTPLDFYPSQISKTRAIWHEALGIIWYQIRY